ncbi:MAG TPA: dihydrofolate reductase family protein [Ohtaekwangia sp.]|uniref:dihydrofolate reductase family protein n=1 Tax=Ohtaekwangia sp. TaxID=2066019 RepID=UPI002F91DEF5
MRKIILGVAVSLDGLIEGPNGEYDWCFTDQDYGMEDFLKRIDAIFYGRKSFEVASNYIFPSKKRYIFSNTLAEVPEEATLVQGDGVEEAKKIMSQPGKDIWLFGGASLTTAFLHANLVDEIWLSIHPIILGSGKPLFRGVQERKHFILRETKTYNTGLVSVLYERK